MDEADIHVHNCNSYAQLWEVKDQVPLPSHSLTSYYVGKRRKGEKKGEGASWEGNLRYFVNVKEP